MNTKQAYRFGVESGLEAGRWGDFSPAELADQDAFTDACAEICNNKRRYASHLGERFNGQPNADSLWDAFDQGEAVGIPEAWRERRKR